MYVFGGVGGAQGWSKLATDSTAWTSLAQEQLSQLSVSSDQDQLMKAVPQGTTQSSPANMSSNGGFAPLSVAGDQCRAGVYASQIACSALCGLLLVPIAIPICIVGCAGAAASQIYRCPK